MRSVRPVQKSTGEWYFTGILLQIILGILVLKNSAGRSFIECAKNFVNPITGYTDKGVEFIFGPLVDAKKKKIGYIFAVGVLLTIVFVGSITGVLYHLGIMQRIVQVFTWVMMRVMHASGAGSLAAAAIIFVGQTEAPLIMKPYIGRMIRSELMALMSGGGLQQAPVVCWSLMPIWVWMRVICWPLR